MGKLTLDIELDWLEEGESFDDVMKLEIKNAVIANVENKIKLETNKLHAIAFEKFEKIIDEKVNSVANQIVDDFVLNHKFKKPKSTYSEEFIEYSIPEMLGEKLESALMKTVDKDGKPTDSSYDRKGTRLDWLTGKLANEYADELVKNHVKDVKKNIETFIIEKVKGEIMSQLSQSVLNNIDFTKLTK